ncbi:myoneurin-like [Panonychus citri]|uniref:myoneurin-like n=1 Tax=Panonychus citri TaxID=50023 RepID=UPI00230780A2|nr:myoneurin-like [Panonychus citri]
MVADYCGQGDDSNEQETPMVVSVRKGEDNRTEDERVKDCADETNSNCNNNDLNGSLDGNKCSKEGKLRSHGAFFSNYSPRLALVDKVLKRSKQSKPMIGPDGRYLYPCDHCQKTFCSSSDLNRHIGFHESKDIRPFKCEFCDYQSRTNSQLKVHVMRHAGIKQYLCHTCNYNGVTQSDLNRHRKTQSHKSRSGNICSICSLGFSTATLLEDHIFKFHDNNNNNSESHGNNDKRGLSASPKESKNGSCLSSSPLEATLSVSIKDGPTASTSTSTSTMSMSSASSPRKASKTTTPPPAMSEPMKTEKVNEMDKNNNNIDMNHNNVLGLNANRFSVNNLL